ncbi:hypothetical protein BS78_06G070100 [Paspalum vaginatum]|nr:hypothetical protein BS78_06G070100 [Paspalum vaginatum]
MVTKAKCKFCSKKYVYTPGGPTTTLNRHLKKQCTPYLTKLAKAKSNLVQGTLTFAACDGSLHVNPSEYDHDHTRLLIAKMIIAHQYPFRMVDHKWFNILTSWMNENYECIELLKKSLREAESISLTTDLWTSNQNIQYMCLVVHYVDVDWVLQCRVLNFVELDPPHTGIMIAQAIFECLVEWKIEDKVMTITLDNASNNDTVVTNLKTKLLARKNTQFDPIYFHVRCTSHIVNLVVNDGLQPIDPLISNVRNTVKYFKRSPARMYKFVEVCNNYSVTVGKGLSLDVQTRWNSTYRMLDSCIHYRDALGYYKEIKPILGTMAGATTTFLESTYPTANVFYPYIVKVKIALRGAQQSADAYLSTMAAAMLLKFDKYWEERNNVMVIATILDPRFKMRYIKWCFGQIYDGSMCEIEFAEINTELENLYNQFEKLYRHKMGDNNPQCAHQSSFSKGTSSSLSSVVLDEFNAYLQSSATESSKSELLIYLYEPNVPVNAHRFPVVSTSSVSSESTFSMGPDTVQALVCASSWIQAPQNDKISSTIGSVEFPKDLVASN